MYRYITILLLWLCAGSAMGQTLNNLDSTYGIGQIKLRQRPKELPQITKVRTTLYQKEFVREYAYTGGDITELNGVKVTQVVLSFYENKLMSIRVMYDTSAGGRATDDFNKVQQMLEREYGMEWQNELKGKPDVTTHLWKGKKVVLENVMTATGQAYINLLERELYWKMMKG